jgi:hypothetical protein
MTTTAAETPLNHFKYSLYFLIIEYIYEGYYSHLSVPAQKFAFHCIFCATDIRATVQTITMKTKECALQVRTLKWKFHMQTLNLKQVFFYKSKETAEGEHQTVAYRTISKLWNATHRVSIR